jgi:hypothetical protein
MHRINPQRFERLPISLQRLQPPHLHDREIVAGGPTVDLSVRLRASGAMDIRDGGVDQRAFGEAILRLTDAGGRPGAGVLAGGTDGPNAGRRIVLADGAAAFQYTPPDRPGVDFLHVSFENGEGGSGREIGQLALTVRSA